MDIRPTAKLSFRFALTTIIAVAVHSSAFADLIGTAYGPVDRSCVHTVPNGAAVHADTGDITMNGSLIAHYDPCKVPWTPAISSNSDPISPTGNGSNPGGANPGGGWYEFVAAEATPRSGLTQYDKIESYFYVPTAPAVSGSDTAVEYFFPSLENLYSLSNIHNAASIIQPVLQWGNNDAYGGLGHNWAITSEGVVSGGNIYNSGLEQVAPGDELYGSVSQVAANEWEIEIQDLTSGAWSIELWYPPSNWPKYNWAQMGVLEGFGNAQETVGLNSCSELPSNNYIQFYSYVYLAGPAWNSFIFANSLVDWTRYINPLNLLPNCNWYPTFNSGTPYLTTLQWTY